MKHQDNCTIPGTSITGSEWESYSFEQLSLKFPLESKPYRVNTIKYLCILYKEIITSLGIKKGLYIFLRVLLWDLFFKKPEWAPEKFNITSKMQERFYKKKFKEIIPVIVFYHALAKVMGESKADRLIANTMVPVVLDMMKSKFYPVEKMESVETWLRQARNYLGREIEKDKGFSGTIYIAKDRSELRFYVTSCAPMQIVREYGLTYTSAALCMCDHITYHTVFPNLMFKRTSTLAIGDQFCDHNIRIRKKTEKSSHEEDYSDCYKVDCMRDFVREWEERAKELFFGTYEEWEKHVARCCNGNYRD